MPSQSDQDRIRVVRDYFKLADQGRPEVLELFHEDVEIYFPKFGFGHGRNAFLELVNDKAKFAASFAADVAPVEAAFMADSQVPWGVAALAGAVSTPAWKGKPSTYIVATDDRMIPPPALRAMAARAGARVVEVKASHALYVSQAAAVASAIEQAAQVL